MTDVQKRHSRRIVRRAVMAVVIPVLLVSWYVGTWALLPYAAHEGIMSGSTWFSLDDSVYAPIHRYREHKWPGASFLNRLHHDGRRMNGDSMGWKKQIKHDR